MLLNGDSSKLQLKRESNEWPCISRNGESENFLHQSVEQPHPAWSAWSLPTHPLTERDQPREADSTTMEEFWSVKRESALEKAARKHVSIWMLLYLYQTMHLKGPLISCNKTDSWLTMHTVIPHHTIYLTKETALTVAHKPRESTLSSSQSVCQVQETAWSVVNRKSAFPPCSQSIYPRTL